VTCKGAGGLLPQYGFSIKYTPGSLRGLRGAAWNYGDFGLASSYRYDGGPSFENSTIGFRVASVPEPTTVVLSIFGSGMLLIRRKRRFFPLILYPFVLWHVAAVCNRHGPV